MNIYTTINLVSNIIMGISAGLFLITVFGNPQDPMWDSPTKAWLTKLGLTITSCGAILNVLTFSTPPPTEIILNCGLSLTFCRLSLWQWETIKTQKLAEKAAAIAMAASVIPKRKTRAKKISLSEK